MSSWRVVQSGLGNSIYVMTEDRKQYIANVAYGSDKECFAKTSTRAHNIATLLSRAPDLVRMLEQCVDQLPEGSLKEEVSEFLNKKIPSPRYQLLRDTKE